jgi:eukaryotic translation initiation factor 2C
LEAIKQACLGMSPDFKPKFTVVICTKNHHFRIFPLDKAAMDRNGNPVPGMVVDRDITHPMQWDFYLNSHSAIQGTARQVRYHVIWDENEFSSNRMQELIYNSCYIYIRATCSVSVVPAVYYAHIASGRARCHEKDITGTHKPDEDNTDDVLKAGVVPLRELHKDLRLKMWYV